MLLLLCAIIALNIYDWWRLRNAFLPHSWSMSICLLVIMLFCLLSPMFIIRNHSHATRFWLQFCWCYLAWSFWLGMAFIVMDVLNLTIAGISHLLNPEHFLFPFIPDLLKGCIGIGLVCLATAWGLYEANHIKIRHVVLKHPAAPVQGYKIAFISDLHLGPACSINKLSKITNMLNELQPNLILSTGDMVDGRGPKEEKMANMLASLETKQKIAVYGNHDVYTGLEYSRKLHETAGFTLVENESVNINEWLVIYGETDPANGAAPPIPEAIPDHCCILLKHRPDEYTKGDYALQLSGHSHGGQIFPFNWLVRRRHPYTEGRLHQLKGNTKLYVSYGTGVWGPPFRLFAPPEITDIIIKRG